MLSNLRNAANCSMIICMTVKKNNIANNTSLSLPLSKLLSKVLTVHHHIVNMKASLLMLFWVKGFVQFYFYMLLGDALQKRKEKMLPDVSPS